MAWQTQLIPWGNDGVALATAATITADGVVGSAIVVGRGDYDIAITATLDHRTNWDVGLLIVQANTLAASTTWVEIGNLCLGDVSGTGRLLVSVTNIVLPVKNCGDHQIRLYGYIQGSALGMTVTAACHPRIRKDAAA